MLKIRNHVLCFFVFPELVMLFGIKHLINKYLWTGCQQSFWNKFTTLSVQKTIIHDYVLISVTVSGSIRVGMLKMSRVNQRETKVFFHTNMKPWVLI